MNTETFVSPLQAGPAPDVDQAIRSRRSVRAFQSTPVDTTLIAEILDLARWAASGSNTQPWKVVVLRGEPLKKLVDEVSAADAEAATDPAVAARHHAEYDYYPADWTEPYIGRRRQTGWGLYGLLGIGKGDAQRMQAQHRRNFDFFGAPVGLVFTIDRILGRGSMLDYGMFLQNIMLAARARGLHTCAQAAWNRWHAVIRPIIGAGPQEMLVCGMALGYADAQDPVNGFQPPRVEAGDFVRWMA
ncbi:nitroreductase [Xylophilus sp. GOD-11R]|uniref:nitroreductase n=1 Tax=Xylophilus sp. GOD-11R TaxID=3089814 RepID=UPI00298C6C53|nr:nitroreductase [Xylophilus sp. GOD-11R]WPB56147.1 nitroreductase [Xylophilus sp. GOD-11R]